MLGERLHGHPVEQLREELEVNPAGPGWVQVARGPRAQASLSASGVVLAGGFGAELLQERGGREGAVGHELGEAEVGEGPEERALLRLLLRRQHHLRALQVHPLLLLLRVRHPVDLLALRVRVRTGLLVGRAPLRQRVRALARLLRCELAAFHARVEDRDSVYDLLELLAEAELHLGHLVAALFEGVHEDGEAVAALCIRLEQRGPLLDLHLAALHLCMLDSEEVDPHHEQWQEQAYHKRECHQHTANNQHGCGYDAEHQQSFPSRVQVSQV
eukprot:1474175-Rhodomonas_salina.3